MPPVLFPIKYAKTSNNFSAMPLCAMMIPPKINSGIASNGVLFNPPTTFLKTKGIEAENPGEIRLGINDTTSSINANGNGQDQHDNHCAKIIPNILFTVLFRCFFHTR